jgi:hypothetical protein
MQPAVVQGQQPELYELCREFEQVVLVSLAPRSLFHISSADSASDQPNAPFESGQDGALFQQAFSAAMERAGGLGLAGEMYRLLARRGE